MRPRGRRASGILGCLLVLTGTAAASQQEVVVAEACKERLAIVLGAEDAVRARMPDTYELIRYPDIQRPGTQRPLVWVSGIRCERLTADGVSAPSTTGIVAALIESPDGSGCLSDTPLVGDLKADAIPFCNLYVLWIATNNVKYAEFLGSTTPDFPVWVTKNLTFEEGEFDPSLVGSPFHFRSRPSAPFKLASDFVVRERPGSMPFASVALWADTRDGTVKVSISLKNLEFGEASGTVRTEPGSELAEVFGGGTGEQAPTFSLIGALRWSDALMTKAVIR